MLLMSAKLNEPLRKRLMKPLSDVAVYSRANWFMVIPFWWKDINKKITTANTRLCRSEFLLNNLCCTLGCNLRTVGVSECAAERIIDDD